MATGKTFSSLEALTENVHIKWLLKFFSRFNAPQKANHFKAAVQKLYRKTFTKISCFFFSETARVMSKTSTLVRTRAFTSNA